MDQLRLRKKSHLPASKTPSDNQYYVYDDSESKSYMFNTEQTQ